MKIEDQVTSLELSKRLRELGVPQKSLFYYAQQIDGSYLLVDDSDRYNKHVSAFTASELLELLPKTLNFDGYTALFMCISRYDCGTYCIDYRETNSYEFFCPNEFYSQEDTNLCNALAKTLIYLIENKLLENK